MQKIIFHNLDFSFEYVNPALIKAGLLFSLYLLDFIQTRKQNIIF
jgi:hypothetical protein